MLRSSTPAPAGLEAALDGVRRVVIIGGGYSGTCVAVQLVRRSPRPLHITLIDPAAQPGRGLAYRATDSDHRLNAPAHVHTLLPDDAWHFSRWCQAQGLLAQDPQALAADGGLYWRRADFGRYLQDMLQAHRHWPATGTELHTVQDTAVGLAPAAAPPGAEGAGLATAAPAPWAVHTASGGVLAADLVFIATGNPRPQPPQGVPAALAQHPAVLQNPLDAARLAAIPPDARLLLLGSGLTALDALSTLVRRGHRGAIVVASRRGLRPRPQGPLPPALALSASGDGPAPGARADVTADLTTGDAEPAPLPGRILLDRLAGPVPAFLAAPAVPPDLRAWLRALRRQVAQVQAQGGPWYGPFDELRDALWRLWPTLPAPQQRRFFKTLRPWYDVHRFRAAPQNQALVAAAEARGGLRFVAARLQSVALAPDGAGLVVQLAPAGPSAPIAERFDAVLNCTGLDADAALRTNPLLASLLAAGQLSRHASGVGLDVDEQCRAITADGRTEPGLRIVGPPTTGRWGDPIGALFIGAHIHRVLPDALHWLGAATPAAASAGTAAGAAVTLAAPAPPPDHRSPLT